MVKFDGGVYTHIYIYIYIYIFFFFFGVWGGKKMARMIIMMVTIDCKI